MMAELKWYTTNGDWSVFQYEVRFPTHQEGMEKTLAQFVWLKENGSGQFRTYYHHDEECGQHWRVYGFTEENTACEFNLRFGKDVQ
jgi:sarcosine oxidase delta subunit